MLQAYYNGKRQLPNIELSFQQSHVISNQRMHNKKAS